MPAKRKREYIIREFGRGAFPKAEARKVRGSAAALPAK